MNNKDLFNGLNHIDDDLIEEAMKPVPYEAKQSRWKKIASRAHIIATIAALLAVVVLGHEVVSLNGIIRNYEQAESNAADMIPDDSSSSSSTAGSQEVATIESDEKGCFENIKSYDELYDHIDELSKEFWSYNNGMQSVEESVPSESDSLDVGASKESFSTTNVMTEGVDESDIVKTDGNYIYMVESGRISITDISNGKPGEKIILKPDFKEPSDQIKEMYVADEKLILIVSHIKTDEISDSFYSRYWMTGIDEEIICLSYDISNPLSPELIGESSQDGCYNTSRKIGDTVYLFTNYSIVKPELERKEALTEEGLLSWLPKVNETPVACDCIYIGSKEQVGTLISSFNINVPEKTIDSKYILNGGMAVYVSSDAIYFYEMVYGADRTITQISKMEFKNGLINEIASTSVGGQILDSFAISQQKNNLFVLSTDYIGGSEVNTLHVFDERLKETGTIDEIARDEQIYAARFVGDWAYFITYRQVDPLFVADISDPSNPKILGELEVEGFSEYLHIWDDNHVLGIGYMIDDEGRRGIKLSMFDVSNPAKPVEENSIVLEKACGGPLLYGEYKAALVDPNKNLIGFATDGYNDETNVNSNSYYLLSYDCKMGFKIEKTTKLNHSEGYRGLYRGDDFYVAGNGHIEYFSLK